jgi:type IV pilus assembly protein PilX
MNHQKGLVLVLSLLILVSVTILGVSAVSGSLLQSKMAVSVQESGLAFDAAEAALVGVLYESEDKDLLSSGLQDPLSEARLGDVYNPDTDTLQCNDEEAWTERFVTNAGMQNQTQHTANGEFHSLTNTRSWSRTAFVKEQSCLGSSAVIGGININCHVFVIRGCGSLVNKPTVVANTLAASVFAPAGN